MILLIDERPEEVTDIRSHCGSKCGSNLLTFDELPDRHKRVSEMVIERAKRLVEHGRRYHPAGQHYQAGQGAYNLTVAPMAVHYPAVWIRQPFICRSVSSALPEICARAA